MASTNKTPNYGLSQFVGTDKASWLGDINPDMLKIDTGMSDNKTLAQSAVSQAETADTVARQANTNANTALNEVTKLENFTTTGLTITNPDFTVSSQVYVNLLNSGTFLGMYGTLNLAKKAYTGTTVIGNLQIKPKINRYLHAIATLYFTIEGNNITTPVTLTLSTGGQLSMVYTGTAIATSTSNPILFIQSTLITAGWF